MTQVNSHRVSARPQKIEMQEEENLRSRPGTSVAKAPWQHRIRKLRRLSSTGQ